MKIPDKFIFDLSAEVPALFLNATIPWLIQAVVKNEFERENGQISDPYADHIDLDRTRGFRDSILRSMQTAMESLAKDSPDELVVLTAEIEKKTHPTFVRLLLSAWAENGEYFADKAFTYIASNPEFRLSVGYGITGGGNGIAAISRAVLKQCGPFASAEIFSKVEKLVVEFIPEYEKNYREGRGYNSHVLLEFLPEDRLSKTARTRKLELQRKFPNTDLSPPQGFEMKFIGSPIKREAIERMTDGQIVGAMRRHNSDERRMPLEGGRTQHSDEIEKVAVTQKLRFANLALSLDESIHHEFLEDILKALVKTEAERDEKPLSGGATVPLGTQEIVSVTKHLHERNGRPSGRWICYALSQIAKREDLPTDVFEIVSFYAIHDSDPEIDQWRDSEGRKTTMYGGDPMSEGINTTRGAASCAIAQMLFANPKRYCHFMEAVESLAKDPSTAVRCASTEMAVALLNVDRDIAVRIFISLQNGHQEVFATRSTWTFLRYAIYSHYGDLKGLLLEMLQTSDSEALKNAAYAIAMQALSCEDAREDLRAVLGSGDDARQAAATIFAHNLAGEASRDFCREQLIALLNDDVPEVRDAAGHCFNEISDEQFTNEHELMFTACDKITPNGAHLSLIRKFDSCKLALPVEVLSVAECVVTAERSEKGVPHDHYWLSQLVDPIFRFYAQVDDQVVKARTLDIIDSMIACGIHGVDSHLSELDR